ncbi:LOW QUALITY PROTEIN: hypothetical protein BC936DRAFT_145684 [Jimgerdemannia flammicorona]|uniref:Uncharacterized protein n=1 Tax=Jimgerdemannia flammicorona TaxID=994334 RepID=A0A433D9D2_9FUNG|nr:LOW QUALITY PROTEIN: hypothetical protein BC936DRAFT_145684 [Jimgerdemannia flammicorona]
MFSYDIHYGYKVQIRNSTASPVGLAVQTDFTPTVLSPRPSSSAPLTITHTYTCRLPHCTGQYTSTKMLATLPMGDTYALGSDTEFSACSVPIQVHASKCKILHFIFGDTIPLTLYFTSDTPEPTDTIFYLVATVSGHFTALPVHPNRRLSWSSSHQFPIRSFFHEDPTTLDITFDKPLELSVPLSALKLPSFRARHSVYNYTLDLQLMAKNFWSPQTAQDVFTFKIPITIVSAWSSLPSPKSYDGGQSVATPYFANRSVKQLTAHERDLGARREKDVFIVKERLEVGRYGTVMKSRPVGDSSMERWHPRKRRASKQTNITILSALLHYLYLRTRGKPEKLNVNPMPFPCSTRYEHGQLRSRSRGL